MTAGVKEWDAVKGWYCWATQHAVDVTPPGLDLT